MSLIALAERRWLPDSLIRTGIRRLLRKRLLEHGSVDAASAEESVRAFADTLRKSPIVVAPDLANQQHYDVPAEFFQLIMGGRMKYSCGYWPRAGMTLDESEESMLALACERAGIRDGMQVLDLGCGWGSMSLWIAERYPRCRIHGVSHSNSQREFIEHECRSRGISNVQATTANVADFATTQKFDRVVSVEMFEHVHNYEQLLARIASWLCKDGKLFVHIFCHRSTAYAFEDNGKDDWMARHFFTGGIMPSKDLLCEFQQDLQIEERWHIDGAHYARTCEAWLRNLDQRLDEALTVLCQSGIRNDGRQQLQRWRMFLMACAEMFNYENGSQWGVGHYLFGPAR
jgi:cyclopropane-fatty-acyl-phospholipid synthase